jgi:hypothetical protein
MWCYDLVCPAVMIYPFTYTERGNHYGRQNSTTGDSSETILFRSTLEGHPNCACDRISSDLTGTNTIVGIDGEHSFVWYESNINPLEDPGSSW